jgi:hypothetical protein
LGLFSGLFVRKSFYFATPNVYFLSGFPQLSTMSTGTPMDLFLTVTMVCPLGLCVLIRYIAISLLLSTLNNTNSHFTRITRDGFYSDVVYYLHYMTYYCHGLRLHRVQTLPHYPCLSPGQRLQIIIYKSTGQSTRKNTSHGHVLTLKYRQNVSSFIHQRVPPYLMAYYTGAPVPPLGIISGFKEKRIHWMVSILIFGVTVPLVQQPAPVKSLSASSGITRKTTTDGL